jgi:hypothetical protein
MMAPTQLQELDSRYTGNLAVQLFYAPHFNEIWLSVKDERSGADGSDDFFGRIPNEEAWNAFNHPFSYILADKVQSASKLR